MKKYQVFLTAAALIMIFAVSYGQKSVSKPNAGEKQVISRQKLNPAHIPVGIRYMGNLVEAYKYADNTGENIVITAETKVTTNEVEGGDFLSNKALYAHRFLKKNGKWEEVWKVYDMEFECMNYPVAEFVKGALSITDIDNNGTAEIWLMYLKSCRGDVSPNSMFLRMYDNKDVYTMTGESKLSLPAEYGVAMGGKYTLDKKFLNKKTPPAFVDFAKSLWKKHIYGNG